MVVDSIRRLCWRKHRVPAALFLTDFMWWFQRRSLVRFTPRYLVDGTASSVDPYNLYSLMMGFLARAMGTVVGGLLA